MQRPIFSNPGISAALAAAVLFGCATPLAKILLEQTDPWLLAAVLYLGSGIGLWIYRAIARATAAQLAPGDGRWLASAIVAGGVVGPVLLMTGLAAMPASAAALLLNAEGVFTALLAWFVFRENFDQRIALGMLAIVAGALVLSWPVTGSAATTSVWPALAVLGACLAWAIDNNLTRKVALSDASWIAMIKGLAAGATNLAIAMTLDTPWPALPSIAGAAVLGFVSFGASLTLFVVALRHLGTARTGAYFSIAPFFGAIVAILLLGEPLTPTLLVGGALMAVGVVLHLTERHSHRHSHVPVSHAHSHTHGRDDEHHDHVHDPPVPPGTRHSHVHRHDALEHAHPHYPDAHHEHRH